MSTKRRIVRMVTLVAALGALGGGLAWAAHTPPDTIFVNATNCPGPGVGSKMDPFCTIQDAVDHASPGDTIMVSKGTYEELVTLAATKSLHLRGKASSKIQCPPSGATTFGISLSEGSIVEGFEITNCVIGIGVFGDGSVVANNQVHGNTLGMEVFGDGNKITDNSFEGHTSHGIVVNGRLNVIGNNKFAHNAGSGIVVADEGNVLEGNVAVENGSASNGAGQFGGYQLVGPAGNTMLVGNVAMKNQAYGFRVRGEFGGGYAGTTHHFCTEPGGRESRGRVQPCRQRR